MEIGIAIGLLFVAAVYSKIAHSIGLTTWIADGLPTIFVFFVAIFIIIRALILIGSVSGNGTY
ncbi:hypothetical protein LCGC14_0347730 [marine sediment metagenome]|uniref:Uncharacterized protein n=1 Tax=marine sediment metagenome TaxID=412755 RepID=A0A0F9VZ82_9ZZZZ